MRGGSIRQFLLDLRARELLAGSFPLRILDEANLHDSVNKLPACIYAGFDPTANSLHVGNLLILTNLLRATLHGCKSLALIGGATARIGDPSGRKTEREETRLDEVSTNSASIRSLLQSVTDNFLNTHTNVPSTSIHVLDNIDWFGKLSALDYLRACRPFRVGPMLRTGAVKARMASSSSSDTDAEGISFTEFSYQTLQSLDWLHLSRTHDCCFQLGGSDQLGHLDMGAHLISRVDSRFAGGVCLPLLTDASGNKLGKSTGATVWISPERTSCFHFYQFWRQLHDTEAEDLLRKYSLRPLEAITGILEDHRSRLGAWIAQDALAEEITRLVHGERGVDKALTCTRALFHGSIADLESLGRDDVLTLFGTKTLVRRDEVKTVGELAQMTRTDNKPASKLMAAGAFKVNGQRRTNPVDVIDMSEIVLNNTQDLTLICWGKRKYQLVQWV